MVVNEALLELEVENDLDVSGSSTSLVEDGRAVLVVEVGLTVVNVSGGGTSGKSGDVVTILFVEVDSSVGLVIGSAVGDELPGQSTATRLPASACPRIERSDTLASSQTTSRELSTLSIPRTHVAEQAPPLPKSFIVQPGISEL